MPEAGGHGPARGSRTLIAFDFGRRRIGVAVGTEGIGTAGPLAAVRGDCPGPDWSAIGALLCEWQPQLLLVGRPQAPDGGANWMTPLAAAFARELEQRFGVPVELVDESLTTREARSQIATQRRDGERRRRVQRAQVDSHAAQLILRSWLAERVSAQGRARLG
jgi:putative pre-16S rRNA nuclease